LNQKGETTMQKYLLYRKGLRVADIDQNDVKSSAQHALSDWIVRERLLLEGSGEREAFTFRFVEMRGYKAGYEGSCYWVSFYAHRPYAKKEGHHPNKSRFDAWVYWDQDRWNVLPFKKATLDDDILILMQSWKKEEQPHLTRPLKGVDGNEGTTTDDIYVDVLQRLQAAQVRLGASITYEEAEHIEEDEEYHEIYVPAGEVQVWLMIEDEIKLYEGDRIVLPHSGFVIDDLEEASLK
jgi:quercetin dioxygenase-like cupin family protein